VEQELPWNRNFPGPVTRPSVQTQFIYCDKIVSCQVLLYGRGHTSRFSAEAPLKVLRSD
jgi:hypothetical protein